MDIQETLEAHLMEIQYTLTHLRICGRGGNEKRAEDLVVIEGGENGLVEIGAKHSLVELEKVMGMVRRKIKQNPMVVCISM
ncbi:hypothetical protein E2C01_036018 [Portunus trituberculatus]|uniref:Uncharacterized protein n=1 Tax=Portunus trituberculatus TaxID=210409 RepID=A0A5B7FA23_PORTR|nr:hypothetical protein [Portunus trituberculatus]